MAPWKPSVARARIVELQERQVALRAELAAVDAELRLQEAQLERAEGKAAVKAEPCQEDDQDTQVCCEERVPEARKMKGHAVVKKLGLVPPLPLGKLGKVQESVPEMSGDEHPGAAEMSVGEKIQMFEKKNRAAPQLCYSARGIGGEMGSKLGKIGEEEIDVTPTILPRWNILLEPEPESPVLMCHGAPFPKCRDEYSDQPGKGDVGVDSKNWPSRDQELAIKGLLAELGEKKAIGETSRWSFGELKKLAIKKIAGDQPVELRRDQEQAIKGLLARQAMFREREWQSKAVADKREKEMLKRWAIAQAKYPNVPLTPRSVGRLIHESS